MSEGQYRFVTVSSLILLLAQSVGMVTSARAEEAAGQNDAPLWQTFPQLFRPDWRQSLDRREPAACGDESARGDSSDATDSCSANQPRPIPQKKRENFQWNYSTDGIGMGITWYGAGIGTPSEFSGISLSFIKSFGIVEFEFGYGIGGAGDPLPVFGHFFHADSRLYPLGRMRILKVRASPYGTVGVAGVADWFADDENADGVKNRDSVGGLYSGVGCELGYADEKNDIVAYVEGGWATLRANGSDAPPHIQEALSSLFLRAGFRFRSFDWIYSGKKPTENALKP